MKESKKELEEQRDNAEMRALSHYSKIVKITDLVQEYNHTNINKPLSANPYTLINKIDKILKEEE